MWYLKCFVLELVEHIVFKTKHLRCLLQGFEWLEELGFSLQLCPDEFDVQDNRGYLWPGVAREGIFVQDYKKLTPSFLPPKLDHSAQMLTGQYVQDKELLRERQD